MTYYKAIRPSGASFHDPNFRWLSESGPIERSDMPVEPSMDYEVFRSKW